MSVLTYWKERLAACNPMYADVWQEGRDYKLRKDHPVVSTWPHSVSRAVIYEDYLIWHNEVFLVPYRGVPYYDENPDARPEPLGLIRFFTEMGPFLYLKGKDYQVRSYPYLVTRDDGTRERKFKYFVRLCEWKDHLKAYEAKTGMVIAPNMAFFDRTVVDLRGRRVGT